MSVFCGENPTNVFLPGLQWTHEVVEAVGCNPAVEPGRSLFLTHLLLRGAAGVCMERMTSPYLPMPDEQSDYTSKKNYQLCHWRLSEELFSRTSQGAQSESSLAVTAISRRGLFRGCVQ